MRILYLSLTEKVSGGERSVFNYLLSLDRKQYQPLILCPQEGQLSALARKNNIPVVFHNIPRLSLKKPLVYLQSLYWLVRFIKKEKINLIHGMNFYTCQIAGPAACIAGIPSVIHGQNMINCRREIYRNFLFLASKIIVCSQAVANCLTPYLPTKKIFLLYHAVHIPASVPKKTYFLHKELGLPRSTKLVAHIGLLEERKCQDVFIEVAKLVCEKQGDVAFLIIGDTLFQTDEYKKKLYRLRDTLQLQDCVLFLGLRKDIAQILPELDIVALPSVDEPLAMVTLEACSFAKPYIGAYTGGTSEIIQDNINGLLVQPKDAAALSSAMMFMLEHPREAARMGKNARKTIAKYCDVSKNSLLLTALYRALLGKEEK